MATVVRPPIITRLWSRDPAGVATRAQSDVWQNQLTTNLRGQDQFFGAGGPNYDYPNPRAPARASDLRTWLGPINLNLLSQDKFFGAGGPNYDYPNPRGYVPSIDLKTWIQQRPFYYSPAAFFGLAGHPNFDQPNPRGYQYPITLRTWTIPLFPLLQGIVAIQTNYDRPNPRGPLYSIDLRTWINQGVLPRGRVIGIPTLCFTSDMQANSCTASDSPSGQNWSGSGYMARYEIDTPIQIEGIFMDAINNVYIDPTEVQIFVKDPNGGILDYTTLDGTVIRQSAGHYTFTFEPDISGTWTYKWQGTGLAPATSPDTTFTVNASALIAG